MLTGLAREHRPEPVDVLGEAVVRVGDELGRRHFVADEMFMHESAQIEARRTATGAIEFQDPLRMLARRAVDEGLAVGKHPLHLHRDEELLIAVSRGQGIGCGNGTGVVVENRVLIGSVHCSL